VQGRQGVLRGEQKRTVEVNDSRKLEEDKKGKCGRESSKKVWNLTYKGPLEIHLVHISISK
jgi:hypothetical protein